MLQLEYRENAVVPLEIERAIPEILRDLSATEIEKLTVYHGNESGELGEFFKVQGDPSDSVLELSGELSGVHWIGKKMSQGEIRIVGNAGRHIGSEMSGGSIVVDGSTGDFLGMEMTAGKIHVLGNAGHMVGSAYRGSPVGMRGGTIMVEGNVGNEPGHTMRRGMIAVGGNAGDLIGFNMIAGSILVFGNAGIRHGAGMRRGTIAVLGEEKASVLPTFKFATQMQFDVVELLIDQLKRDGFTGASQFTQCEVDIYHGDFMEGGRGEILMRHQPA